MPAGQAKPPASEGWGHMMTRKMPMSSSAPVFCKTWCESSPELAPLTDAYINRRPHPGIIQPDEAGDPEPDCHQLRRTQSRAHDP
jgi:hypothetical protein